MAFERDDILSLLLQARREYEGLLQQNDELTTKCHDMEVHCERQRDRNEGLHRGTLPLKSDGTQGSPRRQCGSHQLLHTPDMSLKQLR